MAVKIMKKIGTGFYYDVYDLGNGRVRKIPRSQIAQFFQLFQWYYGRPKTLLKELLKTPFTKRKMEEQHQVSQKVISIVPQYFGNTIFNGYVCEQDKATPLNVVMNTFSEEQCIEYCKQYAYLVQVLWKYKIGEKIFNFANAGINSSGELVFLDTNEYTFDRVEAESKIISKRPLRASSFKRLPESLKPAVREIFEREFSVAKFNSLWP